MATKRLIRIQEKEAPPPPPQETWTEWFVGKYLIYWYAIGCLFLDVMIFLWLWGMEPLKAVAVIAFVGMALLEVFIYSRLWGPGGRFGPAMEN